MKDKILIDTSAWVESFRRSGNRKLQKFMIESLDLAIVATTNIIILELLQGCRDKKEYSSMKTRLESLEILGVNEKIWEQAYKTGYELKRKGVTVPTIDLIIASIAKEHGYKLVHHDRHFSLIAKHINLPVKDFLGK